jgi:hypothetical protein
MADLRCFPNWPSNQSYIQPFLAHSLHQPLPDSCSRANHPVSLSYYMPAPASSFSSESKSPYNDLDKDARRIPLVKRFQQLANNIFNHL